jgi:hypothetical protein
MVEIPSVPNKTFDVITLPPMRAYVERERSRWPMVRTCK